MTDDPQYPTLIDANGNLDRRFKTSKDLIGITPSAQELMADEIDGQLYSYKKEWRCKVCTSDPDLRRMIDAYLVHPYDYRETLRLVTPFMDAKDIHPDKRPSYFSIRNHQKRHLPFDKFAVREIVERRAAESGRRILDGQGRLLTTAAVLETVQQKGWDRLVEGAIQPDIKELLDATMKLHSLEQAAAGQVDIVSVLEDLQIVLQSVRRRVPAEMWAEIASDIEQAKKNRDQAVIDVNELPPAP